jgi:hypothetical protein
VLQFVAAILGAVAILVSPADLVWKLGAWSALVFATWRVHAASFGNSRSGWLELLPDGTVQMNFHDGTQSRAVLMETAWTIRWFSVLALFEPDSGRHYHCVVCASENSPDEYRRLLCHLHMRSSAANLQKAMRW